MKQKIFSTFFSSLNLVDFYTLLMLIIYNLFYIVFFNSIPNVYSNLIANTSLIILIISIALITKDMNLQGKQMLYRKIIVMPIAYFIYSQIFNFIKVINPKDYDSFLTQLDISILGSNIADIFHQISFPVLTEYLQITYFLFYLYPIFLGIEFSLKGDLENLAEYAKTLIFGFYLSYLLYLFLPAVGPRFYLYNFATLNTDLPGIWLTDTLRNLINIGGGIIDPLHNPVNQVNRDCFPSGHTMMTFITIILAFKYNSKLKYIVLVLGSSLIISTLYLRYHYLVDMVAGLIFGFLTIYIEPKFANFLKKHLLKK